MIVLCCVWKVKELSQQLAEALCSLEKCSRDKMSVAAELELARSQLNSVDIDYSKVPAAHHSIVPAVLCVVCC